MAVTTRNMKVTVAMPLRESKVAVSNGFVLDCNGWVERGLPENGMKKNISVAAKPTPKATKETSLITARIFSAKASCCLTAL